MTYIWDLILYQPLLNLLVAIYNLVGGDMGLAIIVLTILLKILLYPLSQRALKSQRALQKLQPKVEALKAKYKDQKDKLAQELMGLYKQEKVSPMSSCLPLLIQLPFLIALYQVFRNGLNSSSLEMLYPFIHNPGYLADTFLGWWHLAQASWPLGLLTAAAQYWQSKMLTASTPTIKPADGQDGGLAAAMNKQMLYVLPGMTFFFSLTLPGGLILYWLANTILTIGQQYIVFRRHDNPQPNLS
jgi:YidC/Oxa1 family membrane protein insertase